MQQVILLFLLLVLSMEHNDERVISRFHDQTDYKIMEEKEEVLITLSAAGDCTLGTDKILEQYNYPTFLDEYEAQNKNEDYFFKNVVPIFTEDDLTIVNLETTLTHATKKAAKKYRFKGYPEFTNILNEGGIDAVSLANNHTYDYLEKGYEDTQLYLEQAGIGYFGYEKVLIKEIKGVKIGLLGYTGWTSTQKLKNSIKESIDELVNQKCELIIVSFHWGEEYTFYPNQVQQDLAHYVIDEGAHLVLGHHPHVIQGIEKYKDNYIVYSLANFCFGGNLNPKDKDTFIFQQTFKFVDNRRQEYDHIKLIPCSVSSVKNRNNFQPKPVYTADYERIINRINQYSKTLGFYYQD